MDYEKKYKEALELARVAAFNGHQSLMEGIFPELKEPEDEKIRKTIIRFFKDQYSNETEMYDGSVTVGKAIAWLEKQETSYTKRDVDDAYLKGLSDAKNELEKQGDSPIKWNKNTEGNKPQVNHSVLMKTTHGIAEGEWKGEYWEQYRWAGIVRDSDVLSWMELSDLDKQGEQEPWSEKDEKEYKYVLKFVDNILNNCGNKKDYEHCKRCYDWLKSLRPQPKQEWSEEDEKMIGRIRGIIEAYAFSQSAVDVNGGLCEKEYIEADNWLNSLKERIGE